LKNPCQHRTAVLKLSKQIDCHNRDKSNFDLEIAFKFSPLSRRWIPENPILIFTGIPEKEKSTVVLKTG
jgi:hypothetical protein